MPIFETLNFAKNWFYIKMSGRTILKFLHCTVRKLRKHNVEITEFYCHDFFAKFPSNQHLLNKFNLCKLLWRKKLRGKPYWNFGILLPRFFSQKFRQINVLLKNFTVNWFDGRKFAWQLISRFSTLHCVGNPQCGNFRNLLSLFWQQFRETNFILKKLLKSWFGEIFLLTVNFSFYHTVKSTLTHLDKNFVKLTFLLKEVTIELIWRKKSVRENFAFFHAVQSGMEISGVFYYQDFT